MLDLADFALQEQSEDNLMVAISRAWYNGSYTMAAMPIKFLSGIALYNDPVFNNCYYRITPLVLLITCSSYLGVTAPSICKEQKEASRKSYNFRCAFMSSTQLSSAMHFTLFLALIFLSYFCSLTAPRMTSPLPK